MNALFVALAIGLASSQTLATPLGLATTTPTLTSNTAVINYLEFAGDGDLSAFDAIVDFVDGVSPVGLTKISFGIGFPLLNPTIGASGGFDIFDEAGLFLDGDLVAVGFHDNTIELHFSNLGGSAISAFGPSILGAITFDPFLGSNPFSLLRDGDFYTASITLSNIASESVPEPGTLALLIAGLLGLGRYHRLSFLRGRNKSFMHSLDSVVTRRCPS